MTRSIAAFVTSRASRLLAMAGVLAALGGGAGCSRRPSEPVWAYGFTTSVAPGQVAAVPGPPERTPRANEDLAEQTRKRQVAGSTQSYSLVEVRNGNDVADWFPGDHPPLTRIMKHGPASLGTNAYGCAFCHMPNGKGRPENAPLAGLPVGYFVRQMKDMQNGIRTSADPRKDHTLLMIALAKAMTDAEIKEAADYFALLPWTPWIRVIETDKVPRTKIIGGMFVPIEAERTEAIDGRIIEVPEDAEQAELCNPRSGFIAYVPPGSIAKGKDLVTTGGGKIVDGAPTPGKTLACITCHGPDLNGVAEVPGIAGRSPSYIVRQLYDVKMGTRKSPLSQVMLPVVPNLDHDDLVAIAAYVSSLRP